jgi:hypothetical protein
MACEWVTVERRTFPNHRGQSKLLIIPNKVSDPMQCFVAYATPIWSILTPAALQLRKLSRDRALRARNCDLRLLDILSAEVVFIRVH